MSTHHPVELSGQGEDEVEIASGQKLGTAFLKPSLCDGSVTGSTASVAAGVVDIVLVAAVVALGDLTSQGFCPAPGDIEECTFVAGKDGLVELTDILGSVPTDDLRQARHEQT